MTSEYFQILSLLFAMFSGFVVITAKIGIFRLIAGN